MAREIQPIQVCTVFQAMGDMPGFTFSCRAAFIVSEVGQIVQPCVVVPEMPGSVFVFRNHRWAKVDDIAYPVGGDIGGEDARAYLPLFRFECPAFNDAYNLLADAQNKIRDRLANDP